ncbi:MAG: type II toxin-antitoxin system HipA family toxin [Herbiconiux sp.]|nr:type II toxin-antitoxin system HipA family toxin [Herbiconiux sp.]
MSAPDLERLRFVDSADVYKAGRLCGSLRRIRGVGVEFAYDETYLSVDGDALASTLPLSTDVVLAPGGSLPAFFAGLLPEGRRLSLVRSAAKTSLDDELTLLLAVGADVPGDAQIVPGGEPPDEPPALVGDDVAELDLLAFVDRVDRHGIPGVQEKLSAEMISTPVRTAGGRFILKLDPVDYPHLVRNERAHLTAARRLGIPASEAELIQDARGADGLLVRRFDRMPSPDGSWRRRALEDATQVLGLPPADKYRVDSTEVVRGLAALCSAPLIAVRNLYLQFVFAWVTGNGDLHAKNVSVLGDDHGRFQVAPIYDIPCTLLYGDDSLALPVAGRTTRLRARHWAEFASEVGLPERAAASANALALRAASGVDLDELPFSGSPLRAAQRELGFRRSELGS